MDETLRATTPPTFRSADGPRGDLPSGGSREPSSPAAWSTRLTEGVETIYLAFRINVVWILLTLLGLVVLGIAPATVAAADAFIASRHGQRVKVLPTMWESYRRQLGSANARLLPLLLVQCGAVAMVWVLAGEAMHNSGPAMALGTLAAVVGAWATISLAIVAAVPRVRDQELVATLRLALMIPPALPLRSLSTIVLVLAWVVLCSLIWPLMPLLGGATAIGVAVALLGRRTELLLEDVKKQQSSTDDPK